jgi:hypothetical protein
MKIIHLTMFELKKATLDNIFDLDIVYTPNNLGTCYRVTSWLCMTGVSL